MLKPVGYNTYLEIDGKQVEFDLEFYKPKTEKRKERMTPENFCYWIRGYLEITRATGQPIVITDKEVRVIEDHLNLVLNKVTPDRTVKF